MNYYDELGVSQKATPEEIRQAYKTLARLLHPDNQPDEKMRLPAERQMKRLNEIFGMLLDPVKRREYDEGLYRAETRPGPPPPMNMGPGRAMPQQMPPMPPPGLQSRWVRLALQNWFWILISAVLVGSTTWFFMVSEPAPPPVRVAHSEEAAKNAGDSLEAAAKAAVSHPAASVQASPERPAPARVENPAAEHPPPHPLTHPSTQAPAQPAASAPAVSSGKPSPFTAPVAPEPAAPPSQAAESNPDTPAVGPAPAAANSTLPAPAIERAVERPNPAPSPSAPERIAPAPAVEASAPNPGANSFAGEWLFNPQNSEPPKPGFYPPEYIEFSIVEQGGTLSGKYKARFKVSGRLISSDVLIAIQGKAPGGKSALLPWSSADGAKGEMELFLKSPNSLNVNWWTTQFGRRPALSSGTSLLIRQQSR